MAVPASHCKTCRGVREAQERRQRSDEKWMVKGPPFSHKNEPLGKRKGAGHERYPWDCTSEDCSRHGLRYRTGE